MKYIFFLFISLVLFSCRTAKENDINNDIVNNEKVFENDTLLVVNLDTDGDGVLDSKDNCPEQFGTDSLGCPKLSYIVYEKSEVEEYNRIKLDEQQVIKRIEKHENKTQLKVVDRTSDSKLNDTTHGWIAYSVPEEMKVAKSYSIKVRISKKTGQTKADLILGNHDAINNPQLPSIATIEDVKVSGEMSAELRADGESFDIKALSTPVQNIDNESYTEWEWIVTPKKSGNSPIKLIIKVKELNKDIVVFNKSIKIQKNVTVAVEGFFEKYWQWLMTTIIIPIFIYFWNRKKKKRQTKKS